MRRGRARAVGERASGSEEGTDAMAPLASTSGEVLSASGERSSAPGQPLGAAAR